MNFDDISRDHEIDKATLDRINTRLARSMNINPAEVAFTSLQEQAFNTEGFWLSDNSKRHIIIQGATSSGKTLVSEMAILDTLKRNNKCIILVPLRAMVRERWEQLRKDLEVKGSERQIYASSADYQDHDGEIINGDYTVAVIVYEKFFNMLSQSNNRMLETCALLVVDELQMLSNSTRGPKLEIAIQKVLRRNELDGTVNTRIMCLTTSDCNVNFIKNWLTIQKNHPDEQPPILIVNPNRPTTLHEHVIQFNGNYKGRTTFGENDSESTDVDAEPITGRIDIPNYNSNDSTEQKKRSLLLNLLRNVHDENPDAKILVFVGTRDGTRRIAEFIAGTDIIQPHPLSGELMRINDFDDDDYQQLFKNKLFPRGIACHNASISTTLREYVEGLFSSENTPLKLVVATETLTIGMNMPVDVMILFDHKVPRVNGNWEEITSQEYKNYVGRAGRLGQKNMNGGKSYIFAGSDDEARKFWDKYVKCPKEEINSSLKDASEVEQAPYYLSLINVTPRYIRGYSSKALKALWLESFSNSCGGRQIDMNELCAALVKKHLCIVIDEDDEDDEDSLYSLTDFGRGMVPYAFCLDTCKKIERYFFDGGYYRDKNGSWHFKPGNGGLPKDTTDRGLEQNQYLLDILYILCSTQEVKQIGQIKLPSAESNPDRSRAAMDSIEEMLLNIIDQKKYTPWQDSPILRMVEDNYVWEDERAKKEPLMRAIVLWYWTQGWQISEIRREHKLFKIVPLVAGDVARLAETVSYQIESIYHCQGYYRGRTRFSTLQPSSLYHLSTRVNYGVPQELVKIANCHVHGLDRRVILNLGKFYNKISDAYDSLMQMIKNPHTEHRDRLRQILRDEDRQEIIDRVNESNTRESIEQLLENIKKDSNLDCGEQECAALEKLYNARSAPEGDEYLLTELKTVFNGSDKFRNVQLDFPIRDQNFASIRYEDKLFFLVLNVGALDNSQIDDYEFQLEKCDRECRIIFLTLEIGNLLDLHERHDRKLELVGRRDETLMNTIDLAMTLGTFSSLIAQAIKQEDLDALFALLWDMHGTFDRPLKTFNDLLLNYAPPTKSETPLESVQVLWDNRKHSALRDLKNALTENKISYRELPWGEELDAEPCFDEPTLIFLNWRTVQAHNSLKNFCTQLRRRNYRRVYGIFESRDDFLQWGGDPSAPCKVLAHCDSTQIFADDIKSFKLLLDSWQSREYLVGISYAHDSTNTKLFTRFVELVQESLPEVVVLFDQNPSSSYQFHGNEARDATLEKYAKCKYFAILDDEYYDRSENCRAEHETIRSALERMPDNRQRLWFLHPRHQPHCPFYRDGDYSTDLTESNVENAAREFVRKVRSENF